MSDQLFPLDLPGFAIGVRRTTVYATTVLESQSGVEQRGSWWSGPRYRYELTLNFARQRGPTADEVATLTTFLDDHAGRMDSFLFNDPLDGEQRRVRFDTDELELSRFADGIWEGKKIELISVKVPA